MNKYEITKTLGEGTYGEVYLAIHKATGETVAIKKLKKRVESWQQCLKLPEVESLRKMNNHPHIIKLLEIIQEFDCLYFVFENMETNLFKFLRGFVGKVFLPDESEVRNWCFQMLTAIAYVHKSGYIHRDLKPDNFLVSMVKDYHVNIKLADFGMAKEDLFGPPHTIRVGSVWYRAPEVLLGSYSYDSSIDMWSMGAIMAELFTLEPLFKGSSEVKQMSKICAVIGSPVRDSWVQGLAPADLINGRFVPCSGIGLSALIPTASKNAISLISSLCSWDPRKRPTAEQALHHPFFNACYPIPQSFPVMRNTSNLSNPVHTSTLNAREPERKLHLPDLNLALLPDLNIPNVVQNEESALGHTFNRPTCCKGRRLAMAGAKPN